MLLLFYILVIEQILQGAYSLFQGTRWAQMARGRLAQPASFYRPRVALFCPVKGLERGLEENLASLTRLDYVQYEIFFAIADADDPAYPLLESIAANSKRPVHIVRAGPARDCGEKVNNLRAAVAQAGSDFEVLVFTDSDGRLPRRWLSHLVAPLSNERVGAATTFRWLLPAAGGFWSGLVSAWNAPVATYLGAHRHNFCWGGGTGIRRKRFEEVGGLEVWSGSVSDDYSLTRALQNKGFEISFVPECLVASWVEADARSFFEFTNRQFIITRVYAPRLWLQATMGHAVYSAAVLLGVALWASRLASGAPSLQILLLALLPPILGAMRGVMRLVTVVDLLPEWREQLLAYAWVWTLLAPVVPFLALYNATVAAVRRTITWRGKHYVVISSGETRVLGR
jgi:ceramide glucosyltransferase